MAMALVISAMISSCSSKPETKTAGQKAESITSFRKVSVDTTMTLFANYEKPDCHLQLNFDVPDVATSKGSLEMAKALIISLTQDGNYSNDDNDVDKMISSYTKTYVRNYLEDGNEAIKNYGNDIEAAATWMTYEEKCKGTVLYNADNILSYSVKTYSYTGGAHGNSTNCVASLCLANGKNISLEDLFSNSAIDQIREQLVLRLNESYQLLTDEIEVTENFYLSDKGITFVYDPFEIAAYSEGEIAITLGWDKVAPLLLDDSVIKYTPLVSNENQE